MIRWEYKTYLFDRSDKMLDKLNQFGAEGWEAFQFFNLGDRGIRVLFKRQTQPPVEQKP